MKKLFIKHGQTRHITKINNMHLIVILISRFLFIPNINSFFLNFNVLVLIRFFNLKLVMTHFLFIY